MYTSGEWREYSFDDKLRLYFVDDLLPLAMQENYLNVTPQLASMNAKSPNDVLLRTLDCVRYMPSRMLRAGEWRCRDRSMCL